MTRVLWQYYNSSKLSKWPTFLVLADSTIQLYPILLEDNILFISIHLILT